MRNMVVMTNLLATSTTTTRGMVFFSLFLLYKRLSKLGYETRNMVAANGHVYYHTPHHLDASTTTTTCTSMAVLYILFLFY